MSGRAGRILRRLRALAEAGPDPRGGVSRPGFSPAHARAVLLAARWMRDAGLEVSADAVGNLYGVWRPRGADASGPVLLAGSHLDTVPNGGRFDGALGVVAAIDALAALVQRGALTRPTGVVAFVEEEGTVSTTGCVGSRFAAGQLELAAVRSLRDPDGRPLGERIDTFLEVLRREVGLASGRGPRVRGYLELHVEQGPVLDREGVTVAAVEAVVGIAHADVRFEGAANHAGTTPMDARRDALWGGAEFALACRRLGLDRSGRAVVTNGLIGVEPGATNVVPGACTVRVEVRAPTSREMDEVRRAVEAAARGAAGHHRLEATVSGWQEIAPQALDPGVQAAVREAARELGLPCKIMPSWAGHDAAPMAAAAPAGMLFVPSVGGISHAPGEYTRPEHVAAGVEVLEAALARLDRALP